MARLQLNQVGFQYESPRTTVFEGLDLSLETTWCTALVGRNGCGKSTLLGLLAGRLRPSRGSLAAPESIGLYPFEPENPELALAAVVKAAVAPFETWEIELERLQEREDVEGQAEYARLAEHYEERGGYTIDARLGRELDALGLGAQDLARPFSELSSGERARALIAALFLRDEDFVLIDEPTNHLDMDGRELLGRYLGTKPGYLLVSHDRHFIDLCCDHVVSINKGDVRVNQGDYSSWRAQMDREEEHERRRIANLEREVRSLSEAARRRRGWSDLKEKSKRGAYDKGHVGHMAAKQMKRAQASERRREEKLSEKQELLRNAEKDRAVRLRRGEGGPEQVLSVHDLAVGRAGRAVQAGLSFQLERGERLAILGPNGCGKTTLLDVIAGELEPLAGSLHLPRHLEVVRAHQEPPWQRGSLRSHLTDAGIDETLFRTTMGSVGLVGEIFERPLETFSLGELKKVDLCRSFLHPAHLLLWDEPMNYIDLDSREDIEEVILQVQPTMLFVEHDRRFVERIATAVLELDHGALQG